MSLPGLGLAEPDEAPALETTSEHQLAEGSEWRFEVAFGKHVTIKVRAKYSFNLLIPSVISPSRPALSIRLY
jgi:hypothetical protein